MKNQRKGNTYWFRREELMREEPLYEAKGGSAQLPRNNRAASVVEFGLKAENHTQRHPEPYNSAGVTSKIYVSPMELGWPCWFTVPIPHLLNIAMLR